MTVLWIVLAIALAVVVVVVGLNLWARRAGYTIPGRSPVRCSRGHPFLTTWVMGGSLTTLRLRPLLRWGRCPVGHHWGTMRPVKEADLTDEERTALYSEDHS